jgi:hypothetical protein
VRKERRIDELRKLVDTYDARLLLPNMGIDPKMSKQAFEQMMALEKAHRDELDELIGVRKKPKQVEVPNEVLEDRARNARLTAQVEHALELGARQQAFEAVQESQVPRAPGGGILLYGYEKG